MSQPAETRIRSEYQVRNKPDLVAKWEKWANQAPSDMAALVQLAYVQAQQIRAIKLVLVWTLIILPIAFSVGLLLVAQAIEPAPRSTF